MAMKPIRLNTSDAQKAHSELGAMGWTLEKRPEGLAPVVVACYSVYVRCNWWWLSVVDVFISALGPINTQHSLWDGNPSLMFAFMRRNPDKFFPFRLGIGHAVSRLESDQRHIDANRGSGSGVITFDLTVGHILPNAENPSRPTPAYAEADSIEFILDAIRRELTDKLLKMLPKSTEMAA